MCRSDYVDCLRAMSRLELRGPAPAASGSGSGSDGADSADPNVLEFGKGGTVRRNRQSPRTA